MQVFKGKPIDPKDPSFDHPVNPNRGYVAKKAMGRRVKVPGEGVMDVGRGVITADGGREYRVPLAGERYEPVVDIEVLMYNDEPGVYYDMHGRRVPEAVAASAGWDVEREKRRAAAWQERQAVHEKLVAASQTISRDTIETRGEYSLVEVGDGLFTVTDATGLDYMTPNVREAADLLFDQLAPKTASSVLAFEPGTFTKKGDKNADSA